MLNPSIMSQSQEQPEQPTAADSQRLETSDSLEADSSPGLKQAIDAGPAMPSAVRAIGTALKEMAQIVIPAVALALVIHIFLAQATVVFGQSMQPNLQPAERLVIEKFSYYFNDPVRNEIIVLDMPQMRELLIKRVVGLPGETVEIREGRVLINGVESEQPYAHAPSDASYGPVTLDPNFYFVLGDNRNNSNDSRSFGPVHRSYVAGRAWMRYWPLVRFTVFR